MYYLQFRTKVAFTLH